jgi:glycosyltransferase involved in cell wall biosynthesis
LRILQIAPVWETVPPPAYGGTESVVHLLCEELVSLGHEVTLSAAGDSRTSARLQSCIPFSLRTASWLKDKTPYSWQHAALSLRDAADYDIVHNHGGEEVMAITCLLRGTPVLTTAHCNVTPDTEFVWEHYEGYYNAISHAQGRVLPAPRLARYTGVAYNGVDADSFPFSPHKEDFLLYLARIAPEKGPHVAIEVARRAGKRLVMAGKVDHVDREFFETAVRPWIDGDRVVFVGEADGQAKRDLYGRARAVLAPLLWDEPFGLVLAEAQACGTPVLTFNRGAAPEIVVHGRTGFVTDDMDGMMAALSLLDEINPAECRSWVSERFSGKRMAERYLEIYEGILGQERARTAQRIAREDHQGSLAEVSSDRVA